MLFFESPALCFCQTVACGPRCRSAPLHHHHFFQRYYKNSQMYKPHECYIIRSLQHEFILCETGSDPCFIYIIIMDSHISTVHLSAQTRIRVMTPDAQLFCFHIVFHSTMIIVKITTIQCHEIYFLIVG